MIARAMFALCERCLADDPAERPANAGVVKSLFERAQGSPRSIIRSKTRKRFLVATGTLVATAALGVGFYRAISGHATQSPGDTSAFVRRLDPVGQPVDWRKVAKPVALGRERVHCFAMVDDRTAQLVLGTPRRVENVDVVSGARSRSPLSAETFEVGCPQRSPDGSMLLFSAHTGAGASEVRLSSEVDGSKSRTITAGAEPLWLGNSREFIYDLDASHAAVFSLPTMSLTLLPPSGLSGHPTIADKAVDPKTGTVALLLLSDNADWAIAIHDGKAFDHRRTFMIPPGFDIEFDVDGEHILLPNNQAAGASSLTSLNWRTERIEQIGTYPGLEIISPQKTTRRLIMLARHRSRRHLASRR